MPYTFHCLSEAEVDSNTAVAKRVVQEKLVNVGDQMFYVIQGAIIDLNSCKDK